MSRVDSMRRTTAFFAVLLACLACSSCGRPKPQEDLRGKLLTHPARDIAAWGGWQNKEMPMRIGPAPDILVDYLRLDNRLNGYTQAPKPAVQWQSFAGDVTAAIDEFPADAKRHLKEHVLGICLVTDLGTSAYTETLRGFERNPMGFIVLDTQYLDKKANDWATWRENTPFRPSAALHLSVRIAPVDHDTRTRAISYIILHELGHLVGVARGCHGSWWGDEKPDDYAFASMSWTRRDGSLGSKWDGLFPDRGRIRFYAEEKSQLPGDRLPGIYADLAQTDFVSLYAATGIYDDFAETYAMYVHVVLQARPWQLAVHHDGKPVLAMTAPLLQERCGKKRDYLAALFGSKSQPAHADSDHKATVRQEAGPFMK